MLNEMLDLGRCITGLALDLDETDVGVIILGDYTQLEEGDEVRATGKLLQVPVGKGLLGRVVNTLGEPVDGKGPVKSDVAYPVEKIAPGIIRRRPAGHCRAFCANNQVGGKPGSEPGIAWSRGLPWARTLYMVPRPQGLRRPALSPVVP